MRFAGALVAIVLGVFFTIGSAIAILFELQGFGRPRDTDARIWYVALLVLGLAACVAMPAWLLRRPR